MENCKLERVLASMGTHWALAWKFWIGDWKFGGTSGWKCFSATKGLAWGSHVGFWQLSGFEFTSPWHENTWNILRYTDIYWIHQTHGIPWPKTGSIQYVPYIPYIPYIPLPPGDLCDLNEDEAWVVCEGGTSTFIDIHYECWEKLANIATFKHILWKIVRNL